MTKQEAARRARLESRLCALGFTDDEAAALRRISSTLTRWHELECGTDSGALERDEKTGLPFWVSYSARYVDPSDARRRSRIPDREAGALRRLAGIIAARNGRATDPVETFIQTDPRGAALYILRPGDIPAGYKAENCYTNGICIY